jgi:hypothetical protein
MSINPPRTSGGSRGSGRLGGGQVPPVGLNPPVSIPSKDPIDSFGTPGSASQTSPASGPIRPVCSSQSPAPYDTGFETPHAQRMSSASQAASTSARRQGTMSPSPAPSYALRPIAPMSEGGGGSPFMSLGSPTPSASGEGWRRPEQYAGALRTDAAWLHCFLTSYHDMHSHSASPAPSSIQLSSLYTSRIACDRFKTSLTSSHVYQPTSYE